MKYLLLLLVVFTYSCEKEIQTFIPIEIGLVQEEYGRYLEIVDYNKKLDLLIDITPYYMDKYEFNHIEQYQDYKIIDTRDNHNEFMEVWHNNKHIGNVSYHRFCLAEKKLFTPLDNKY